MTFQHSSPPESEAAFKQFNAMKPGHIELAADAHGPLMKSSGKRLRLRHHSPVI
jgi:hypothetical protein